MPERAQPCLLHADIHPMSDGCRAVVVAYNRQHPQPFTSASRRDYLAAVEQAMADKERALLDDHIRRHLAAAPHPAPAAPCPPTAPVGTDHLEQAA